MYTRRHLGPVHESSWAHLAWQVNGLLSEDSHQGLFWALLHTLLCGANQLQAKATMEVPSDLGCPSPRWSCSCRQALCSWMLTHCSLLVRAWQRRRPHSGGGRPRRARRPRRALHRDAAPLWAVRGGAASGALRADAHPYRSGLASTHQTTAYVRSLLVEGDLVSARAVCRSLIWACCMPMQSPGASTSAR